MGGELRSRRPRESTIFGLKALRRMLLKKVRGQTEAAARRRRALALASLPAQGNKQKNKNIEIATSRMWGPEQQKEL